MAISYTGRMNIPNIVCLSSDVSGGTIAGANPGMVIYYSDTKAWKIVKNDLTLADYVLPVGVTVTSDIEIGAVEIKNSTDDTRATVGANGLEVEAYISTINQPVIDAVEIAPFYDTKSVAVRGTSEPLTATDVYVMSVVIFPFTTNAGNIYLGTSGVDYSTSKQIILTPTSPYVGFDAPTGYKINLAKLYIDKDNNVGGNADGVYFLYLK